MTAFADSAEVVTCTCPAAQSGSGAVWGTDTYTADSATCRAALHAGLLPRQGGTVTLEMLPGEAALSRHHPQRRRQQQLRAPTAPATASAATRAARRPPPRARRRSAPTT